jgi:hypothetical protein
MVRKLSPSKILRRLKGPKWIGGVVIHVEPERELLGLRLHRGFSFVLLGLEIVENKIIFKRRVFGVVRKGHNSTTTSD